ncbi:MAG: DMT family protein [Oligoflexales bacterium]|nr:DMT family protein [Oligoflexales bacterium]
MIAFKTISLLLLSNIFMLFAWYGHLKFKNQSIWIAIVVSWGIAFFEYCAHVPANRIGHEFFTAPQLKMLQEVITFFAFTIFSILS